MVIDCDTNGCVFKLVLMCGDILFATHLFFDEMTVVATRDKTVVFDTVIQHTILVFSESL